MSNVKPRSEVTGIIPYPVGPPPEQLRTMYGFDRIIKMSDNETPYGPSALAMEAAKREIENICFYPDGSYTALMGKLAEYHGLTEDSFVIGSGSDEVIRLLTRAYISSGDEAVIAAGTFPRYRSNVMIEGGIPIEIPLTDGTHNLDGMLKAITENTKMVFVCNPNNPTGTIVEKKQLADFIERVPDEVLLIIDEAYYEYVSKDKLLETVPLLKEKKNLVILRTFSKIHGLAGLRIGYGMMNPEIAAQLTKVKDVFNVNRVAAAAATASLSDSKFLLNSSVKNAEEKAYMNEQLLKIGFTPLPSEANFLYIPVQVSAPAIAETLAKQGIFIKAMSVPGYPQGLRVTLGTREENDLFLVAFSEAAAETVVQ